MAELLSLPDGVLRLVALNAIGIGGFRGWGKPAGACKRLWRLELHFADQYSKIMESKPMPSSEAQELQVSTSGESPFPLIVLLQDNLTYHLYTQAKKFC